MLNRPMEIERLLPHRGTMLLISKIVSFDERSAVTQSVVAADWPLVGPEGANALILVELVAQTAGINNGWELLNRDGPAADQRGWIVGIKSARFHTAVLPLGTVVHVEAANQFEYDNFREIAGVATVAGKTVGEVTLQLMQAAED